MDEDPEPTETLAVSLDATGITAGSYYFNAQNAYEYTRNAFNYTQFTTVSTEQCITEVVQYAQPDLQAATLDSTKEYRVPQTHLVPAWAARVDLVNSTKSNSGFSGVDASGNTYVLAANQTDIGVVVYSSDNVPSILRSRPVYSCGNFLTKYDPNGVPQWCAAFYNASSEYVNPYTIYQAFYAVTDATGTTYIVGNAYYHLICEDANGNVILSVSSSNEYGYILAYGTTGTPLWLRRFSLIQRGLVCVSNSAVVVEMSADTPVSFFDPLTGSAMVTVPASNVIVAKFTNSGLFLWATYVDGYRLSTWNNFMGDKRQSMCSDSAGNLYVTGYYTEIRKVYRAATRISPTFTAEDIPLPPYSTPVVWNPRATDRNWSAVSMSTEGEFILAADQGGYLYLSTDFGETWTPTASPQQWTCVYLVYSWWPSPQLLLFAGASNSVLWRAQGAPSAPLVWQPCGGEGGKRRDWVALTGNDEGSRMVAAAFNDTVYYSDDFGLTWTSRLNFGQWSDVAYSAAVDTDYTPYDYFLAVHPGQSPWFSENGGNSWTQIYEAPAANWKSASGLRLTPAQPSTNYTFMIVVQNGPLYGLRRYRTGPFTWAWEVTVLAGTNRAYSDIVMNDMLMYATVEDGSIYQAIRFEETTWTPTTIPRLWEAIDLGRLGSSTAVAVVRGGQIYVARDTFTRRHTFVIKYSSEGTPLWTNYLNCKAPTDGDNLGLAVACTPRGTLLLSGFTQGQLYLYRAGQFDLPVKTLTGLLYGRTRGFVMEFSNEGNPTWINATDLAYEYDQEGQMFRTGGVTGYSSLAVDAAGTIYAIGTVNPGVSYYNPGQALVVFNSPYSFNYYATEVAQYHPDGTLRSFTRLHADNVGWYTYGTSVGCTPNGEVFVSGLNGTPVNTPPAPSEAWLQVYASMGNTLSFTEYFGCSGIFVVKYTVSASPAAWFSAPVYNATFAPQLSIGGGSVELREGYPADGPVDIWGGRTGLAPSSISLTDANAAVISYLNREPLSTSDYRYLTMRVTEPKFPPNDPEPVTPSTVPYGFLPIQLTLPAYATGAELNTGRNDTTPLILSVIGTAPTAGAFITGVRPGDQLRFLVSGSQDTVLLTVNVRTIVVSAPSEGIPASLVFEEPTVFGTSAIGRAENVSIPVLMIGTSRYAPVWYRPPVIRAGQMHVVIQTLPKPV